MDPDVKILHTGFETHDVKRFPVTRPNGFRFEPGQGVELAIDQEGWRDEGRPFSCGPPQMVQDIQDALDALGADSERVVFEG